MPALHRNLIAISRENYESASELTPHGRWNAATNRLYYSVFQLLYMDLLEKGKLEEDTAKKHEFTDSVAEEEYGREISELFRILKRLRIDADYKGIFIGKEKFECMKSQVDLKYDEIKRRVTA